LASAQAFASPRWIVAIFAPLVSAGGAFFCPSVFSNFYKILEGIEIGVFGSFSGLRGWGLYFYTVWLLRIF
jgi:hypothetical protein